MRTSNTLILTREEREWQWWFVLRGCGCLNWSTVYDLQETEWKLSNPRCSRPRGWSLFPHRVEEMDRSTCYARVCAGKTSTLDLTLQIEDDLCSRTIVRCTQSQNKYAWGLRKSKRRCDTFQTMRQISYIPQTSLSLKSTQKLGKSVCRTTSTSFSVVCRTWKDQMVTSRYWSLTPVRNYSSKSQLNLCGM